MCELNHNVLILKYICITVFISIGNYVQLR